jgi:hypothetical protein
VKPLSGSLSIIAPVSGLAVMYNFCLIYSLVRADRMQTPGREMSFLNTCLMLTSRSHYFKRYYNIFDSTFASTNEKQNPNT